MDYQQSEQTNKDKFMELLKVARPEIHLIAKLMDDNKINPNIVFYYLQGLIDVANSTKFGNVVTEIENNLVRFIRAQSNRKINLPVLMGEESNTY